MLQRSLITNDPEHYPFQPLPKTVYHHSVHEINREADISQILCASCPEDSLHPALRSRVVDHSHEHHGGNTSPEAGGSPVRPPAWRRECDAEEADA